MLKIKDAGIRYGNQQILSSITLEIDESEIYVLMGPSGSGKTTLLRGIAGLSSFSEGTILWKEDRRGQTGLVFQEPRLFPHMTVLDNLAFGLRARAIPAKKRYEQVKQYLSILQLEGLENRYPHQLSGGQQQRVSLGRVLVLKPDLLLLDEPFASLDAPLRVQLTEWLYNLQKQHGFSILWITHYMDEAFSVADRVGLLMNGRILQEGKPLDFYQRPRSEKVATFFSLKNRFSREQWQEWLGECFPSVPTEYNMGWLPAESVQLTVHGSSWDSEKDKVVLDGRVKRVKYEPKMQMVLVEIQDHEIEVQHPIWGTAPEMGTSVKLCIPVEKIVWYPKGI
ncbi:ABC transporter ATP-binding protein [Bacillus tuaregi]|uniref:ABC transporter ATP-binding protein n=1 Tax=Bacillus tuaregi TaxID=1816695 RepID=UPI000AFE425C|nr:ABC transporter ATP-binding protein [Bacillus tuaregi]